MRPQRRHLAVALALLAAMPLRAQSTAADMVEGEVRKVDRDTKKLTLKHGEIRKLDMPPMTMVFQVKDAAILDKLKPGDKVRFVAEKTAAGFVVTELQPVP
ncbi:MAG: copper-binding protein [Burkholderiaceae bacterium]